MANEGSIRAVLKMTKGDIVRSFDSGSLKYDISESAAVGLVTLILTDSYASLSKGSITTARYLYILNVHASASALISMDGGSTQTITVPAGLPALIPLASGLTFTNIQAKVATGAGSIDYAVLP